MYNLFTGFVFILRVLSKIFTISRTLNFNLKCHLSLQSYSQIVGLFEELRLLKGEPLDWKRGIVIFHIERGLIVFTNEFEPGKSGCTRWCKWEHWKYQAGNLTMKKETMSNWLSNTLLSLLQLPCPHSLSYYPTCQSSSIWCADSNHCPDVFVLAGLSAVWPRSAVISFYGAEVWCSSLGTM